ncbi:succinate dehydrogenase/fumarate reductase cytochrome b subunit [Prevotella sp. P5-126]|jgi:succinate dehydrogenase / fumarate reductase, cytochrome b subunit|uniref:Succinate dehydrogenase/fumarate reductase cytochrome b subunit n=1 Tax=Xylanibacter brevis TaxID=83231 RepID=A0ABS9CC37_9BACT|nr:MULTISPECIES: succinate dehydrogenase/fumarate reductase cytochrome b subunit [Prevotellaceae]MBS7318201.1 succinate dehydrogenase/fumarate reductase cytochrome b subunit [Prevotella sp.]MCF2558472.1 succinate dehydrogenase/fumarate reductase cytochrome b subunit [Xylanibacter brevis]MCF2562691.1 succinate dehydrogenase/fumarate reductase cytochrome b subunit [Xylanibacter brevis]MCI7001694.1 succinate dehydrogenase/fumarate reductase cytochrome b subunit [Prevotella sp.]MDD7172498.1 succin
MWLINSSIGRKVVMSVTGIALILFLTFHGCMNIVALFSGEAYNWICEALGANWYAVVATLGLAALAVIHIVYAFILTAQNRSARGSERYAETEKPAKVEWASQNMLVLGIVVVLGLLLHLFNFWYNMMFAELIGTTMGHLPSDGFAFIIDTFQNPVYVVLYIVWLVALWFHLTHGFWSAMQTIGISGKLWFNRWRVIGNIYVTLLILAFIAVVVAFAAGLAPSLW